MNFYKILKGYSTQARWYAANMEDLPNGEWNLLGWTKLGNGAVKPVYKMINGIPVVILDGKSHLHAVISQVPAGQIFTEDQAHAVKAGW